MANGAVAAHKGSALAGRATAARIVLLSQRARRLQWSPPKVVLRLKLPRSRPTTIAVPAATAAIGIGIAIGTVTAAIDGRVRTPLAAATVVIGATTVRVAATGGTVLNAAATVRPRLSRAQARRRRRASIPTTPSLLSAP
jgi:hypothetical protein